MKVKFIIIFFLIGFASGCLVSNITKQQIIIPTAKAEVAGMNSFELELDYDFLSAVSRVVQHYCRANENGSISCLE